jgi:hypothetical protein
MVHMTSGLTEELHMSAGTLVPSHAHKQTGNTVMGSGTGWEIVTPTKTGRMQPYRKHDRCHRLELMRGCMLGHPHSKLHALQQAHISNNPSVDSEVRPQLTRYTAAATQVSC